MKYSGQAKDAAFSLISPILEATGGLTLSQLSKLTGLEGTTIQNWIKRGWVSPTRGRKKYTQQQVLRILLINMLRGAMKLDDIANLMVYVNGDVEDTSDDIIADELLYNILCKIIFEAEERGKFNTDEIKELVEHEVEEYASEITDEVKLKKAMYVMIIAYRSGYLKSEMEKGLKVILDEFGA
ncbi:MAG: hypothetical protein BWZ04_02297 [Firmicutes bacterium ADurb.BinA205]|nr:MAG: hypothetical protein BWZ04_02297 [Firmicutes bacterium ADurb.BinA205]